MSKTVDESFFKLNEMGQVLFLLGKFDWTDNEKGALFEYATKKDQKMTKSIQQFIQDQNFDLLYSTWKSLVPSDTSQVRVQVSKPAAVKDKIRQSLVPVPNTLFSYVKAIGLDKKNPVSLAQQLKNSFSVQENLSFEEFSKLVIDIDPNTEPLANLNKLRSVKSMFDLLDEDKDKSLSKKETINSLIILSGGNIEDKISAIFTINDTEGDGLISYESVITHLKQSISLSLLIDPIYKKPNTDIDALAFAAAQTLFSITECPQSKLVSLPEYRAWVLHEEISPESVEEKKQKVEARLAKRAVLINDLKSLNEHLKSKENLRDIYALKASTGLVKVPVSNALKLFKSKNASGYFSRQQFTEVIQELVSKYNRGFVFNSDFHSAVCKLFIRFDQDRNGVMDTAELFCGLSLVCAGSLGDKVYAACNAFDESRDGLLQYSEVRQYFKVVFKMILPEDVINSIDPSQLAGKTADNLFIYAGAEKDSFVTADVIKKWILASKVNIG